MDTNNHLEVKYLREKLIENTESLEQAVIAMTTAQASLTRLTDIAAQLEQDKNHLHAVLNIVLRKLESPGSHAPSIAQELRLALDTLEA